MLTIPNDKQVEVALTYVYGIGPKTSYDILAEAKVEPTVRVKDLTDANYPVSKILLTKITLLKVNFNELLLVILSDLRTLSPIEVYDIRLTYLLVVNELEQTPEPSRGKKVTVGGTAKKVATKT